MYFAAGTTLFLQEESIEETVHASTSRICEYLVPIDTRHGIVKLKSGALESFQISVSSVFDSASEYQMGYVKGAAHIVGTKITAMAIGAEAKFGEFAYTPGVSEEVASLSSPVAGSGASRLGVCGRYAEERCTEWPGAKVRALVTWIHAPRALFTLFEGSICLGGGGIVLLCVERSG